MNKILITTILLFIMLKIGYAQENGLNVSFTYDNYIGDETGSGKLLGFRISYEQMKEQFGRSGSWRSGFQFSFGDYDVKNKATRNPYSNISSIPSQIEINGVANYKSVEFEFAQKMYFGNGNIQYGGLYLLIGLGFNVVQRKTTYSYDDQNYTIDNSEKNKSKSIYQLAANVGGGYEFNVSSFNLFIESDINLPIIAIKDIDPENFKFGDRGYNFYGIAIGIRFRFQ